MMLEGDEMGDRRTALDRLGLSHRFDHDLFLWLGPTHGILLAVYGCYVISLLSASVLWRLDRDVVDRLVAGVVVDVRRLNAAACLRLLVAHFLLPLEKFGLVCGLVVDCVRR